MNIAELRAVLSHIQRLYAAAGSKAAAKDLQTIADVLRPHADTPVASFVTELSERLIRSKEKPPTRPKPTKTVGATSPNEPAVAFHVRHLHEAGTQQYQFDEAFKRMNADRSLKLTDVAEIARRYANSVTKYRSLSAARNDISQAFVRRARFENKLQ